MHLQEKIGEHSMYQIDSQKKPKRLLRKSVTSITAFMVAVIFSFSAFAQDVEVTATVDRNELGPEDTLTYTISVQSSGEVESVQPELPPLRDFEIINEWTSQSARAFFGNTSGGPQFQTVRTQSYNFLLQPKRSGNLVIGGAEIKVDGRTYTTKPITVKVDLSFTGGASPRGSNQGRGGIAQPPPGFFDDEEDDLFSQLLKRHQQVPGGSRTLPINPSEAFFIQVETDKTEAYIGEQITVSWYLYTRGQIRDLDTLKYPSLKGFWKEDIEIATHLNFVNEVVNGIPYKKALLASFALFPIKEGTATIDEYKAKCSVIPGLDPFGNFGKTYTYTKSSQPVKVTVKPLPTEGKPSDFSGAVGDFQVSARVEDRNIVANQPFTVKLRFEGRGNAKLIELPPFEVPEGMELYDQQNEARFFRTGTSYKDFSLLLIPRREGTFTIPSFSVSIFDPEQRRYVNRKTEPITVGVGRGQGGGPQASMGLNQSEAKGKSAKAFQPSLQLEWSEGSNVWTAGKTAGFAGLFGLVGLLLLYRARVELGWGQKKKDLQRQLKARMRRVESRLSQGDWRGVGTEMTNAVYFVLGEISGEGGANVELEKLLLKAPPSVRRELAEPLTKQMEVFQLLSFAPEGVVGNLKDPDQMKRAVREMEKLMEKAVALGASSSQSDESGPDPKAS